MRGSRPPDHPAAPRFLNSPAAAGLSYTWRIAVSATPATLRKSRVPAKGPSTTVNFPSESRNWLTRDQAERLLDRPHRDNQQKANAMFGADWSDEIRILPRRTARGVGANACVAASYPGMPVGATRFCHSTRG